MPPLTRRELLVAGAAAGGTVAVAVALRAFLARRAAEGRPGALLRPPGARDEAHFLAACIRCGQCVEACPIHVLHLAHGEHGLAAGTPYVVARENPCNLCLGRERMECLAVCPTGALHPLADRRDVRMGTAVVDHGRCLPFHGVSCRACWHACPFPNEAILQDHMGRPVVVADVCVGCGLCERACLTDEPSIVVRPGGLSGARS